MLWIASKVLIQNTTKGTILTQHCLVADTFFSRLKGLLGASPLSSGEGLLLVGEKSIHTFFMTFPIDVIYINGQKKVIRIDDNVVPNRIGKHLSESRYILEVPVGTIEESHTRVNDQLNF